MRFTVRWMMLGVVATAVLMAVATETLCLEESYRWIDPVSGSTKWQRRLCGFPTHTRVERSAIERWVIRAEGGYSHDWRLVNSNDFTIWGRRCSCGVGGGAGLPIYGLSSMSELSERFVQSATDPEMAEFVRVMRTGSREQQTAAVTAAVERAIDRIRRERGRNLTSP